MRHLISGSKLGKQPAHRRAVLRNLVTNLIEKERIHTTLLRAKTARPIAERMITLGKRDSLHARRQGAAFLMTPDAPKKLFSDLAPRFADRPGGYTRLVRAGWRIGDGAELAILEFIGSELKKKEKKPRRGREEEAPEANEKEKEKEVASSKKKFFEGILKARAGWSDAGLFLFSAPLLRFNPQPGIVNHFLLRARVIHRLEGICCVRV